MSDHNDLFTLAIIQNSLQAISDEMFVAMRKTAMSAIIYEVLDMGTGIVDAHGEIASSGAGIPGFVGVLDKAVNRIVEINEGRDAINHGDVFITNDPFYGGVTHLNDVVLAMPVFVDDEIVAWTANIAHWNDVGGKVQGSLSTDADSLFQEGIRVPAVKIIEGGELNRSVAEILQVNSRMPDFLHGDMWAGIAAARVGERRIQEIVAKYGKEAFLAATKAFMDYGEQVTLRGLETLPKGRFTCSEEQDDGQIFNVAIEISDDAFIVDLRDNPDQSPGPYNATRDGVMISAQMVLKSITDPYAPANGGSFRPLTLLTRPGSQFDAAPPAAHGFYFEVEMRVHDLLLRCLAPHMPERLPSGNFSSICGTFISGTHPDTGRPFTVVEPEVGGWGGAHDRDGNSAMFSGQHGETFNCPVEITEARNGLIVDRLALNDIDGGEGEHRGGKGVIVEYRVRGDDGEMTCGYSRARVPPWGLLGGRDGSVNYVEIERGDGSSEHHALATAVPVGRDDIIRIVTGVGAGFGDPKERDPEKVRDDLRNGFISPDRAREVYGIEG